MVLIQLLLPTTGAAGGDAMTLLAETRRELADTFKGVTSYVRSPAKGMWTAPDGHTEADDVVMVDPNVRAGMVEHLRAVACAAFQAGEDSCPGR